MGKTSDALLLKGLYFGCSGGMAWWEGYGYSLRTDNGKIYFSGSDRKNSCEFFDAEVPFSVLEELSEMARAGGAVGSPVWEDPRIKMMLLDASTRSYDLNWADGTKTGPGTAGGQMMDYLRELAKKYAEVSPKNEAPVQEPPKEEPQRHTPDTLPQETWACPCGGFLNTGRFCAECGSPRDTTNN